MLRIVALLCGLALLSPALVLVWLNLGLSIPGWLAPIAYMSGSLPTLAFVTLGGVIVTIWALMKLIEGEPREYGPDSSR